MQKIISLFFSLVICEFDCCIFKGTSARTTRLLASHTCFLSLAKRPKRVMAAMPMCLEPHHTECIEAFCQAYMQRALPLIDTAKLEATIKHFWLDTLTASNSQMVQHAPLILEYKRIDTVLQLSDVEFKLLQVVPAGDKRTVTVWLAQMAAPQI